jgi:hypothetical protein
MTPLSTGMGDYLRLILVLGGILILAVVAIRFWIPRAGILGRPQSGNLEICARLPLEVNKTLYVIRAGIHHLSALSPEDCLAPAHAESTSAAEGSFAKIFRQARKS